MFMAFFKKNKMKKLVTLLFLIFAFSLNAQSIIDATESAEIDSILLYNSNRTRGFTKYSSFLTKLTNDLPEETINQSFEIDSILVYNSDQTKGWIKYSQLLAKMKEDINPTILKAFPTAEGWGKFATGGRGYDVYKVTNLNDSGTGSLRQACLDIDTDGGGYVEFEVGGTITLLSEITVPSNITIAGQTAFRNGGQGVTIRQNGTYSRGLLSTSGQNQIVRHLRLRRGAGLQDEDNGDASTVFDGGNIIYDHCSFSWTTDETFNTWADQPGQEINDITLQWCIFGEALHDATHASGVHSKSMLIGANSDRVSIYSNYFVSNVDRNPLIGGTPIFPKEEFELKNNIIYNWGYFGMKFGASQTAFKINIISNRVKSGTSTAVDRYGISADSDHTANRFYVSGNITEHRTSDLQDEWDVMGCVDCGEYEDYMKLPLSNSFQSLTPYDYPLNNANTLSIADLETAGLDNMGANLYEDATDVRLKDEYNNGGESIKDDVSDTPEGWVTIQDMTSVPVDSDDNGIPDAWETSYMNGAGANDIAPSGYPWVEEYLTWIITGIPPQ